MRDTTSPSFQVACGVWAGEKLGRLLRSGKNWADWGVAPADGPGGNGLALAGSLSLSTPAATPAA